MKKYTFEGKRYVKLGDLDNLCHNLCKEIYDSYKNGEDGKIHLSDIDIARTDAIHRVMHEVMIEEIKCAESPDDIRQMHDKLRHEWMDDKFIIVANDDGENVFYRKECPCGDDGEYVPVFTSKVRQACTFDDHYAAYCTAVYLEQTFDYEVKVEPLYLFAMTGEEAKKMLQAIFRDEGEDSE